MRRRGGRTKVSVLDGEDGFDCMLEFVWPS